MKTALSTATVILLVGLASPAFAQAAPDPHAGHSHGSAPAVAAPTVTPSPSASQDAKGCDPAKPMAGMANMQGKDGKQMDHQHMSDCKMPCCEHMKHGATPSTPAPTKP